MKRYLFLFVALLAVSGSGAGTSVATQTPPECSDGVDNDGDGQTDFPDDQQCQNPEDDAEEFRGDAISDTVTIRYASQHDEFRGWVIASDEACVNQRRLTLQKKRPYAWRTIARTFATSDGRWKVFWPGARGTYRVVSPRVVAPDGTTLCSRDQSRGIHVR